jgi:hypothetical protein
VYFDGAEYVGPLFQLIVAPPGFVFRLFRAPPPPRITGVSMKLA